MYGYVYGYPCVQLMGSEGPIGCSTGEDGKTGWLYPIENDTQWEAMLQKPPSHDVVFIIASKFFTPEHVTILKEHADVEGIVVLPGEGPEQFSPGDKYPNKQYGLYPNSTKLWNTHGTGWNYVNQDIQIFAVDGETGDYLLGMARTNMKTDHFPKYAIQLTAWMYTRKEDDVETCMRRGDCSPLGGRNLWSSFNKIDKNHNEELVFVMGNYDSNAFFHDLAVGSDSDLSATVAILGAIEALTKVNPLAWVRQPLFALFTGEAYGYIGSKSFVEDLTNFECDESRSGWCYYPYRIDTAFTDINIDAIHSIIELNQIGHFPGNTSSVYPIYAHKDPQAGSTTDLFSVLQQAADTSEKIVLTEANTEEGEEQEIPPSSLMSFLLKKRSLSGMVITEFESEYKNPYFESRLDTSDNINFEAICEISTFLARSVFLLGVNSTNDSFGLNYDQISVDCELIAKLYSCLAINYECDLLTQLFPYYKTTGKLAPPTNYVSVYSHRGTADYNVNFMYNWIANITAQQRTDTECKSNANCSSSQTCLGTTCVSGYQVYFHDALSPAFEYNPYERAMKIINDNGTFPMWTEAYWRSPYMKIFVQDAPYLGWAVLFFGVLMFIASFLLVKVVATRLTKLYAVV